MTKFSKAIASLALLFLAGCQAPAPSAPPVVAKGGLHQAAPKPLRVLPEAAKRRLLAAEPALSRLWGFQFQQAWWDFSFLATGGHEEVNDKAVPGSKLVRLATKYWGVRVENGWRYKGTYSGDGELRHLDQARFLYKVPAGRVLILNRAEMPGRIAINGFPLATTAWERTNQLETVDYVFGPGEEVLFTFPFNAYSGNDRGQISYGWDDTPAAISGMTADPAIFGGSLPDLAIEAK